MSLPKILIFGQPFNNFSGGGITLTNLFRGWEKNKIAVTYKGHGLLNVTTDVCNTYYQLGREEHKWIFPLNMIQRKFSSGLKSFEDTEKTERTEFNSIQKGLRYRLVNNFFYPTLKWLGIFHFATRLVFSERFRSWLHEYSPEIIYIQVAARDEINFAIELIKYLNVPASIHMMDDWPSTISTTGLFKKYWSSKIDKEFKSLLDLARLHLSISDAMAIEYESRYKKRFLTFHNPINAESWLKHTKTEFTIDKQNIRILYSGRIGDNGIAESLIEVAEAIDALNESTYKITLHIQTPSKMKHILDRLGRYKCVVFNPFVEYRLLPEVFAQSDILLLANDFSLNGIRYLKYSMPTKASEYMISGTPILVYTPPQAAVSEFFRLNECGYCLTTQGRYEIIAAIRNLIEDEQLRIKISRNAVSLARERFEAVKVSTEFQKLLSNL